ncbi:MAG: UDP-4-amino-4,6-dideoxy-N-acetyl-beta-L-altrosamine transaminase [Patescibacteria group bacterium]|nr:UDP-4-amino-4,6-dideoxy-N-acetyl-beta-L-altrosamine transaminase [Patescibacteria group bacterium]
MRKIVHYSHQWIDNKDIKEVLKVLKSDWITQGLMVQKFEKAVAKYCGAKYAVAVSSGTAALHSAYSVAGIGRGDEVITTSLSFAATANAVIYCGGKPIFSDIKADTLNIDPKEIEKKITKKTKAIAPVDFAGHPCDYHKILKIAKRYNLLVIEDASHSLGSKYKSERVGTFADFTTLSFHAVKTITTGEGGMVLTNNKAFYEKLKIFRHHGIVKKAGGDKWYYEISEIGHNYRLTDFQCALGLSQLKKIDKFIKKRREIVKKYNQAFKNIKEIITPTERDNVKSAWHIYVIQLSLDKLKVGRGEIFRMLQKEGIGVQVHYVPLYLQPFYVEKFGYKEGNFPITDQYYQRAITLPLFPKMTDKEVDRVIKTVQKVMDFYKKC